VINPNPDAVAEFRVLESNYSAEYGRNGGGVVSVVTRAAPIRCTARLSTTFAMRTSTPTTFF